MRNLGLIITFSAWSFFGFAQCKSFTKKICLPELSPYIHNGQLNTISLFPGESASLNIPFYAGQEYRAIMCGDRYMEDGYFEVKTSTDELLYSSKTGGKVWDFSVNSTQELIIDIYAPVLDDEEVVQSECASFLVGFGP